MEPRDPEAPTHGTSVDARLAALRSREPAEADERTAAAYGRLGRAVGLGFALSAFVPSLVKPDKDHMLLASVLFFVPVGLGLAIAGTVLQRRGERQASERRAWERELRSLESEAKRDVSAS
jgi:hypothetical protein